VTHLHRSTEIDHRLLAGERFAAAMGAGPGFFLLDTLDVAAHGALVLAGTHPVHIISGKLPDLAPLLAALEMLPPDATPTREGAWVGGFAYNGEYRFALYRGPLDVVQENSADAWKSNATLENLNPLEPRSAYESRVRRAQEYIAAGDIYQVNLAQQATARFFGDPLALHLAARRVARPDFGAFLRWDDTAISCASPELFLAINDREIMTRPIKGTRRRASNPSTDAQLADELRASPKERAEIIMITDLERNDLGRVCEYGSVRVPRLAYAEQHPQVHHLVSEITGILRPEVRAIEAVAACFPGGSITGAPKLRAMEIIAELEPFERRMFCGAMGWFSGKSACFNIAIRLAEIRGHQFTAYAGAGIVADSVPEAEYDETLLKMTHWEAAAIWLNENRS